ncbi:hypothetical protein PIB30_106899 [Stylosanthes scabra]|uniref:Uncharacterized protein n=1 Tax=Stylosanthes scabra TaxID=79078 RepID=A0ABU6RZF9_9FABA|nr:hypothetical protein [Stylosanthes scabra]
MRPGKEIDSAIITAYSLVLNDEPIPRFQNDVYILPPRALSKVMNHFKENYIDLSTNKGNLINQLLVKAGYQSLLTKATKTKPEQRSWLPKYIKIHKQPNP